MPSIEVNNVGPVEEFRYELADYGVHVLRGRHGAGKTTVLRTVQLATDGRSDRKPAKSDGVPRGDATVAGKTLCITRSVRTEGELSVEGLGDLSIADLHTPRYDNAETRDRHRIASLLRLVGVKADAALFYPIAGGRDNFNHLIDADSLKTDDLVEMAARVKRRFERLAVEHETRASKHQQCAAAEAASAAGVDVSQPDDADALADTVRDAIRAQAALEQQRVSADQAMQRAFAARERLASLPPPKDLAALNEAETAACRASDFAELERKTAWEAYQAAEARRVAAARAVETATAAREAAQREQQVRDELDRTIAEAAETVCPTDTAIADAAAKVRAAHAAVETGVRIRAAKDAIRRAAVEQANAKAEAAAAENLRKAAKGTLDVLCEAIAGVPNCPLRVAYDDDGDARLVIATTRSDEEPFDERSDGERWRVVLDIAASPDRLIVLPQAAFGELSDGMRDALDRLARERRCYILTAQADDGELRAQPWRPAREAVPT